MTTDAKIEHLVSRVKINQETHKKRQPDSGKLTDTQDRIDIID